MGTYTTNYQLYIPTVGENGWGTLVNENFTTIDTTMKSLSNRITAVENEVNGALSCTSVTTSGKVTANSGITSTTGTFNGAVTGSTINGASITSTKFNGVTIKNSGTITVTPTSGILCYVPIAYSNNEQEFGYLTLLPLVGSVKYSGSLKFLTNNAASVSYQNGNGYHYLNLNRGSDTIFTFSDIPYLIVTTTTEVKLYGFTLT